MNLLDLPDDVWNILVDYIFGYPIAKLVQTSKILQKNFYINKSALFLKELKPIITSSSIRYRKRILYQNP